jgi:hypothetical protein
MPTDRTILELKMRGITNKKIERNRSEIEIEIASNNIMKSENKMIGKDNRRSEFTVFR